MPFSVGETLTYDVGWSTYLVAGSAISRVVEKRPGKGSAAYYIVAEGRPLPIIARLYPLYYKMDSLIDSLSTLSQRTSLYTEEGSRQRSASTTLRSRRTAARSSRCRPNRPRISDPRQRAGRPGDAVRPSCPRLQGR